MKKGLVALLLLVGVGAVTGTVAYLTDKTDEVKNEFHLNGMNLVLHDETLGSRSMDITPLAVIKREPTVEHTGGADAYVKLDVSVPYVKAKLSVEDNKKVEEKETPLYTYNIANVDGYTWNKIGDTKHENNYEINSYEYGKIENGKFVAVPLREGETTKAPLFDNLQLVNIIEGNISRFKTLKVKVDMYGISSEGFKDSSEAWSTLNN